MLKNILTVSYIKNKGVWRLCFIIGILLSIISACIVYENFSLYNYNLHYENITHVGKEYLNNEKLERIYAKYPFRTNIIDSFENWEKCFIQQYSDCHELITELSSRCIFHKKKLLEGARNLKFKGYTPQQVDAWLQTHGSSLEEIKNYVKNKKEIENMNITLVRNKYPQYNDLTDRELTIKIYEKYFNDVSIMEFSKKFGYPINDLNYSELKSEKYKITDATTNKTDVIFMDQICKYLHTPIEIQRYNFLNLISFIWVILWFYLPFLIACIIRWVYVGFKENKE